jgi:hypothetical protein
MMAGPQPFVRSVPLVARAAIAGAKLLPLAASLPVGRRLVAKAAGPDGRARAQLWACTVASTALALLPAGALPTAMRRLYAGRLGASLLWALSHGVLAPFLLQARGAHRLLRRLPLACSL